MRVIPNRVLKIIGYGVLLDENIPNAAAELLQKNIPNVKHISDQSAGMDDQEVLEIATKENRILITFDKDFGYLVFKENFPKIPGVVLLRFDPVSPQQIAGKILDLIIGYHKQLHGSFTVVEEDRVRIRPIS